MFVLSKKVILWYAWLPDFQFNEGKGYKGIRTIKIFEFEKTRK